jgi:hypothetical protein
MAARIPARPALAMSLLSFIMCEIKKNRVMGETKKFRQL